MSLIHGAGQSIIALLHAAHVRLTLYYCHSHGQMEVSERVVRHVLYVNKIFNTTNMITLLKTHHSKYTEKATSAKASMAEPYPYPTSQDKQQLEPDSTSCKTDITGKPQHS